MLTEQNGIQVDKFYPPTDWQYSFPEGYTRLEYLEGTGTQWLNTGITASQDLRVRTKIYSKSTNNQSVFCTRSSQGSNNFALLLVSGYFRPCYNTTYSNSDLKYNINTLYDIDFNKNNFYVNGQLIKTFTYATFSNDVVMRIANSINAGEIYYIGRIYPYLIYNNDVLVANLIPVKRNSDGELGMLDLIQDVFRTNRGTGTFIAGPELYSNNSQIDIRQKNNTNFVEKYKFNTNNELVWANPQLNLSGPVNYSVVGSPTIVDGVASGFSDNNYIKVQDFSFTEPQLIIRTKYRHIITDTSKAHYLYFYSTKGIYNGCLIRANGYFSFSNSIQTSSAVVSQTTVSAVVGETYNIEVRTDINTYFKAFINGNLVLDLTYSGISNNSTINDFRIGNTNPLGLPLSTGSIDLKETYIKVNNKLWFYGKNYTSKNYAPVPAGLNYNNTTTPSIGYVNTQTQEFIPAPTDGIKYSQTRDIKVIPPDDNTITLLYGVASDFSKYSLFGLLANTSSGNYDVYIDDVLYATTASATQTDIDFSTLGAEYVSIGTCTTPEELVLHKIVIKPTTSGETITVFRCARTSGISTTQNQGVLWCHLELINNINIGKLFASSGSPNQYVNRILYALTSKNDRIIVNYNAGLVNLCYQATNLNYLPEIIFGSTNANISAIFYTCNNIKRIKITNLKTNQSMSYAFAACYKLEQLILNNSTVTSATNDNAFVNNRNLKIFPEIVWGNQANMTNFLTNAKLLYPTNLDISSASSITKLNMFGSSTYPMRGLRGLKVSNEAPFSATSPQINVSYTGLDRDALVELFNSLPTVTDGQAINITAASGNNLTKVGTPTIDANGVASGFSTANYIKSVTNITFTNNDNWEIVSPKATVVNTTSSGDRVIFNLGSTAPSSSCKGYIRMCCATTAIKIGVHVKSWSADAIGCTYSSFVKVNDTIQMKISYYNKQYKFYCNKNDEGWIEVQPTYNGLSSDYNFNITCLLGQYQPNLTAEHTWLGSIDLTTGYIKVNNNYIVKGYLTDNDKAILTRKNWTLA